MAVAKSTTGNSVATENRNAPARAASPLAPEERRRMIAEAAYYRAQARGSKTGNALDDWLAAEAEIDRMLASSGGRREERVAYERLRAEVQKGLSAVRGSVDAKAIQDTIERATNRLKRAGGHATENINKATESLRKDLAEAAARMGPRWEAFSDKSADLFGVWRDRGSVFLSRAALAAGQWLQQTGQRLEQARYRSSEMADAGDFQCLQCGEVVRLETSGELHACPKCRGGEFRRAPLAIRGAGGIGAPARCPTDERCRARRGFRKSTSVGSKA